MAKLGRAILIQNVMFSLDYTKTSQDDPGTVFKIQIPTGRMRIISFGWSADSNANANFEVNLNIDNAPFVYPNGTSTYNSPALSYQLCGSVPTDYIEVEGGNYITLSSVMTGSASTDGTLYLTVLMKPVIGEGDV